MLVKLMNVYDYEELAAARMEAGAWAYYQRGAGDEVTLRENRAAFERLQLRPRMLIDVSKIELATSVLGIPISMPAVVAPTAFHRLANPEGECATARGAGRIGTLMTVSTSATRTLEEIARAASGPLWFQLYVSGRAVTERLVKRVHNAGYRALVLTVDAPRWGTKERAERLAFDLPPGIGEANFVGEDRSEAEVALTWELLDWLRSLTDLPLILKGLLTAEDALLAVEHGVDGIVVSNHGGRQLDGVPATIEALPEIVEAVNGRCEVYLDGGIRRGTDILKALALGARAVMVGRPILWGLAANGEEGVFGVLEMLRAELELTMALAGCPRLETLDRSLLRFVSGRV